MVTTVCSWEHGVLIGRVEELSSHHHLLLLSSLSTWCFPLIDKVEQMSLIGILVGSNSASSSYTVVSNRRCSSSKSTTSTISLNLIHHIHIECLLVVSIKITNWLIVTCIALSEFSHEIAIKHGLSHLSMVLAVLHGS